MIFANVTDIVIPQGNVIKIHETNGGRVLWEKKAPAPKELSAHWELDTLDRAVAIGDRHVSTIMNAGNELVLFCVAQEVDEAGLSEQYYCFYNPKTRQYSNNVYVRHFNDDFEADLTCVCSDNDLIIHNGAKNFYFTALVDSKDKKIDEITRTGGQHIWVEELDRCCCIGLHSLWQMDKYGNVTLYKEEELKDHTSDSDFTYATIRYVPELHIFLLYRLRKDWQTTDAVLYNRTRLAIYSENLEFLGTVDNLDATMPPLYQYKDSPRQKNRGMSVVWASHLNSLFAICSNGDGFYIYKSFDGFNWVQTALINPIVTSDGSGYLEHHVYSDYSPKKNVIAFFAGMNAYISHDGVSWKEITTKDSEVGTIFTQAGVMINTERFFWSDALDAFLYRTTAPKLNKLVID